MENLDDDGKLASRFRMKAKNAKDIGIGFELSFEEYCVLLVEAGIKSSNIGWTGYHLARYNDTGPYKVGNCRFIPYSLNLGEQKPVFVSYEARSKGQQKRYLTHKRCVYWETSYGCV